MRCARCWAGRRRRALRVMGLRVGAMGCRARTRHHCASPASECCVQRDRHVRVLLLASCVQGCVAVASDKAFRSAAAARARGLACARPPAPPSTPRRAAAGASRPRGSLRFSVPQGSAECASCARGGLAAVPGRDPYGAGNLRALRCSASLRGPIRVTRHPWLVLSSSRRHVFAREPRRALEAKRPAPRGNQPWMAGSYTRGPLSVRFQEVVPSRPG
jgi:hypothetical protein